MLGKLLKHEFWATSRIMLPVYAGSLILAFINRLFMLLSFRGDFHTAGSVFITILTVVFSLLFAVGMAAVPTVTAIFIIRRFYTHLLRDEGYLTHTLPIGIDGLLWSKLIPAFSWVVAASGVMILNLVILLGGIPFFDEIREYIPTIREMLSYLGDYRLSVFLSIVIATVAVFGGILHFYFALSVGQLANQRKILAAIGVYFGVYFASTIATTTIFQAMIFNNVDFYSVNTFLLISLAIYLIPSVVYYLLTRYLLKNRLNLQ